MKRAFIVAYCLAGIFLPLLSAYAIDEELRSGSNAAIEGTGESAAPTASDAGRALLATTTESEVNRALLATTTEDYPVTPGDVYVLTFFRGTETATSRIFVEGDYKINLGLFGSENAAGVSFRTLKEAVEKRVLAAYPKSTPQLSVLSTGVFSVFVCGEVERAEFRYAWGLSRLSELWSGTTPYASSRNVTVRSREGIRRGYDLFMAGRGALAQDPYLRPGDVVEFQRAERRVSIQGDVRRPGLYEVFPGEGIAELVEKYGGGFTELADPTRIVLTRILPGTDGFGAKRTFDYGTSRPELLDRDELFVSAVPELLPVAYFEGALGVGVDGQDPQVSRRIVYTFHPGDRIGLAAKSLKDQFSAVSDLERAFLLRAGERLPVDLSRYIYGKDFSDDVELLRGDIVVIPFRQFFVSVSGAVKDPGRYPYVPDRDWTYYVGLAGGFDTDRNSRDKLKITDSQGIEWKKQRIIQPEDSIVAASNSFLYHLGRFSLVLTTVISAVSLAITINTIY